MSLNPKREGCACPWGRGSAILWWHLQPRTAGCPINPHPKEIRIISRGSLSLVLDIKLIRTHTTLEHSQEAEKGMPPLTSTSRYIPEALFPTAHLLKQMGQLGHILFAIHHIYPYLINLTSKCTTVSLPDLCVISKLVNITYIGLIRLWVCVVHSLGLVQPFMKRNASTTEPPCILNFRLYVQQVQVESRNTDSLVQPLPVYSNFEESGNLFYHQCISHVFIIGNII